MAKKAVPVKAQFTQFDYLLNAMEWAGQQANPAEHGYADRRRALYAYVRRLEAMDSALLAPQTARAVAAYLLAAADAGEQAERQGNAVPQVAT